MLTPLVDVIIPSHNGVRFIAEAIASAQAQDVPNRIIVVDDGSTDSTAHVARACGAEVLEQPGSGQASALNLGVSRGEAAWIAFLDDDDLLPPKSLSCRLEAAIDVSAVFGAMASFFGSRPSEPLAREGRGGRVHTTSLLSRAEWLRIGPFATHYRAGFFVEWLARADAMGSRRMVIDDVVLWRRLRPGSMAHDPGYAKSLLPALAAAIRRKRQGAS